MALACGPSSSRLLVTFCLSEGHLNALPALWEAGSRLALPEQEVALCLPWITATLTLCDHHPRVRPMKWWEPARLGRQEN